MRLLEGWKLKLSHISHSKGLKYFEFLFLSKENFIKALLSYNFNNHIKLFYNIKLERTQEFSSHIEIRIYSEMPDFYYKFISNKNANSIQTQGLLDRRDQSLDEIIKKDLLSSALDTLFSVKYEKNLPKLRIKANFVGKLNENAMIANWEKS